MNKQEAIERLKALSNMFEEAPTGAIAEAISALEKQIPKEALNVSRQIDREHDANQNVGLCS